MSTQTAIDKLAAVYAAYQDGDAVPFYDLFADDGTLRFVTAPGSHKFAEIHKGPQGARNAISAIGEQFQWLTYRNLEMIGDGDCVVAINGGRVRHLESGRETVVNLADFVRFKDGKVIEFVEFFDSAGLTDWCDGKCLPACCDLNPGNKGGHDIADQAQRNKSVLKTAYAAYAQNDAKPLFSSLSDDVTFNSIASRSDFSFAGPHYGREAFEENVARIASEYELVRYDVLDMVAQGDLVAVHADVEFRNRATGAIAKTEKLDLYRLFDGKITEFNEFFDTGSARQAAIVNA